MASAVADGAFHPRDRAAVLDVVDAAGSGQQSLGRVEEAGRRHGAGILAVPVRGTPMPHPRMYSEGDPFLAELREVCLSLPESVEVEAWGRPTFRPRS